MSQPVEGTVKSVFGVAIAGGSVRNVAGQSWNLSIEPLVLGRDQGCDIVLDDPETSATHCELRATPTGVVLTDLDSSNGTFVNGVRVREAILDSPCTLRLGRTNLSFEPRDREQVDLGADMAFGPLVGVSPSMHQLFRVLKQVAPTELSVLISGETGTGKEGAAQALHEASPRAERPFVVLDCGAIPPSLAESILFGHERGAFTGAAERRGGAFQEANGGTVFLDELGELPSELQPKLLRVLSEGQVKRVGAVHYEKVDVRVIAATRRDLLRMTNAGKFRSDLYFRLAQVRVELAPLRNRREDIPLIVQAFCERNQREDRTAQVIDYVTRAKSNYDWPGNVRELLNIASVLSSLPAGSEAGLEILPTESSVDRTPPISAYSDAKRAALEAFEKRFFTNLQREAKGNISEMTRRSGLARHHVRNYLRRYGLI